MHIKEHLNRKKTNFVNFVGLLLGFFGAFTGYTLSAYFAEISGSDNVGSFYLVSYAVSFLALFFLRPMIRRLGRARMLYLSLGLSVMCMALVMHNSSELWLAAILLLAFLVFDSVTWVMLDIVLEGYSSDSMSGRIRGLHLSILNTGYLFAPYCATSVLKHFGYDGIFFSVMVGYMAIFLFSIVFFRNDNAAIREKLEPERAFRKLLREKNLLRIYLVSLSLEFFYALVTTIYTSIRLLDVGFSWSEIGIIYTIMLIPFVILQYPLGIIADKKMGEKELLIIGMIITAVSTAAIGCIDTKDIVIWSVLLFMTRVGAATIEVLRDSYFYKQVDSDDTDIIAFFRTARPVAGIFGSIISVGILAVFQLPSIFFVTALFFVPIIISTFGLQDSQSEAER